MLIFDVEEAAGPRRVFARLSPERLAHAYLFSGPAGVGKKRFARLLAQSILCEAPKVGALGYDDACGSCRLVRGGTHPDLFIHEGEMKIGDHEGGRMGEELTARELVRALSFHGYGAGRRVLLLGDVEFATHHAANALLKFFEEPPLGVVLLLTSSTPGKLLDTIRSRLVEVPFAPLSADALLRILRTSGIEEADAARVAPTAQGSVTRARALLEGQGLREQVADWFFSALAGKTAESPWAVRATLSEALEVVALLIRDWAIGQVRPQAVLWAGEGARLRDLPRDRDAACAALQAIGDAQRMARTNLSPGLIVTGLRLTLAQLCDRPGSSRRPAR
jgi:DNA polymerase-3 subunit delta'